MTTNEYQGHRRMTLTYRALAEARQILWLVTGEEKRGPLEGLMAGDESIPAGRVRNEAMTIVADEAASPELARRRLVTCPHPGVVREQTSDPAIDLGEVEVGFAARSASISARSFGRSRSVLRTIRCSGATSGIVVPLKGTSRTAAGIAAWSSSWEKKRWTVGALPVEAHLLPSLDRDEDVDVDVDRLPRGAVEAEGDGAADRVRDARRGQGAVDGEDLLR